MLCHESCGALRELCCVMRVSTCVDEVSSCGKIVIDGESRDSQTRVAHSCLQDDHMLQYVWVCRRKAVPIRKCQFGVQEHKHRFAIWQLQKLISIVPKNGGKGSLLFFCVVAYERFFRFALVVKPCIVLACVAGMAWLCSVTIFTSAEPRGRTRACAGKRVVALSASAVPDCLRVRFCPCRRVVRVLWRVRVMRDSIVRSLTNRCRILRFWKFVCVKAVLDALAYGDLDT